MNVGSDWFELDCRISNGSKSLLEQFGQLRILPGDIGNKATSSQCIHDQREPANIACWNSKISGIACLESCRS